MTHFQINPKPLFYSYLIFILLLVTLPLNGINTYLTDNYVMEIRLDELYAFAESFPFPPVLMRKTEMQCGCSWLLMREKHMLRDFRMLYTYVLIQIPNFCRLFGLVQQLTLARQSASRAGEYKRHNKSSELQIKEVDCTKYAIHFTYMESV